MSAITPDSYIKLVRFDVTKENQLTFPDGVAQVNFFLNTLQGVEMQASSYQRKDYKVRFEAPIDSIDIYNYMIVRNTSYNYKYYFYYITDMTYINDEMTEITIKLDVFQTYQFEYNYKRSFVEREHVNDDTVGKNIVEEGIETGDYIINNQNHWNIFNQKIFLVQVSKDLDGIIPNGTKFGQIVASGGFYACGNFSAVAGLLNEYISDVDLKIESIKNVYQIPYEYTNLSDLSVGPPGDNWIYRLPNMDNAKTFDITFSKPYSIDGYVPKNKKLLTKDYNYLVATNESGASEILAYETFKTSNCRFNFSGIPIPGGSGRITPVSYGNAGNTANPYLPYAIPSGKYPIFDFNVDSYRIWLTNNLYNIKMRKYRIWN